MNGNGEKKSSQQRETRERKMLTQKILWKTPTYVKFFTKPFDNVEQSTTTTAGEREREENWKSLMQLCWWLARPGWMCQWGEYISRLDSGWRWGELSVGCDENPVAPALSLFLVLCTRDDEEENGEDKKCGKCEEMENILWISKHFFAQSRPRLLIFKYQNNNENILQLCIFIFLPVLACATDQNELSRERARLARARTRFLIETNYSRRLVFDAFTRTLDCLCFCFFPHSHHRDEVEL